MLLFWYFLKGFALGFCVAVPVGPIGILCVQKAFLYGRRAGFATGMGAAAADALYGLVAALGLASVTQILQTGERWFQLGGGVCLLIVGYKMARAPAPQISTCPETAPKIKSPRRLFTESFLLTLTNPMTFLGFFALFATFGLPADSSWIIIGVIVAAVLTGSACWWFFLSTLSTSYREKLTPNFLARSNQIAGGLIAVFGAAAFVRSFLPH